jgi:hypothetical protein
MSRLNSLRDGTGNQFDHTREFNSRQQGINRDNRESIPLAAMKLLFRAGASVEKIIRVAPVPPTAGFDPLRVVRAIVWGCLGLNRTPRRRRAGYEGLRVRETGRAGSIQGGVLATARNKRANSSTVIASAAKQSRGRITPPLDCFVARAPRNDGRGISVRSIR